MRLTTIHTFDFYQNTQRIYFSLADQGTVGAFRHCDIQLPSPTLFQGVLVFSTHHVQIYPSLKAFKKHRPPQIYEVGPDHPYRHESGGWLLTLNQSLSAFDTLIDTLIEALSLKQGSPEHLQTHLKTLLPPDILNTWSFETIWNACWLHRTSLGNLTPWMQDPHITEILINGTESIYCEKHGKLERQPQTLSSLRLERLITKLLQHSGRTVNTKYPLVDFQLSTGERVHIALPPIAKQGPVISIRKFKKNIRTLSDLASHLHLTTQTLEYLTHCVGSRKNILVSGGTAVGKTTLLNCLLSACNAHERLIIVEDTTELCPHHPHVLQLETRTVPHEPEATLTLSDLMRNALRMRPTRIICGECRGPEVFQLLLAMNSGHPGSMTTIHANSPLESLYRLEIFLSMAGMDISHRAIRQWIASSIHVIIQLQWINQTQRRITHIVEVNFNSETQTYALTPVFGQEGLDEIPFS